MRIPSEQWNTAEKRKVQKQREKDRCRALNGTRYKVRKVEVEWMRDILFRSKIKRYELLGRGMKVLDATPVCLLPYERDDILLQRMSDHYKRHPVPLHHLIAVDIHTK